MIRDRRQDIVNAAIELFARNGFRGTTTRDLAGHAGVNEAIIFRHFKTKRDLYSAILDLKLCQGRDPDTAARFQSLIDARDDEGFFTDLARSVLTRHEQDSTFMRLILFSALEGHELAEMFMNAVSGPDKLRDYILLRTEEGAFRDVEPTLVAMGFMGMLFGYVQRQEIFRDKNRRPYEREFVVRTFVSLFLRGIQS